MQYDSSKLRGRIIERFGTIADFAKDIDMSRASVSTKLAKGGWKQEEILKACDSLDIKPAELHLYFFSNSVRKK